MNGTSRPVRAAREVLADVSTVTAGTDVEPDPCTRWCTTVGLEVHVKLATERKTCPCPRIWVVTS